MMSEWSIEEARKRLDNINTVYNDGEEPEQKLVLDLMFDALEAYRLVDRLSAVVSEQAETIKRLQEGVKV